MIGWPIGDWALFLKTLLDWDNRSLSTGTLGCIITKMTNPHVLDQRRSTKNWAKWNIFSLIKLVLWHKMWWNLKSVPLVVRYLAMMKARYPCTGTNITYRLFLDHSSKGFQQRERDSYFSNEWDIIWKSLIPAVILLASLLWLSIDWIAMIKFYCGRHRASIVKSNLW